MDSKQAPDDAARQASASALDSGEAKNRPANANDPDAAPATRSNLMNFLAKLLTLGRKF